MIKLEITADTPEDLRAQLASILGGPLVAAPAAEAAAPEAKPAPKKAPAKAAEPKAEEKPVEQVQETPAVEETTLDFNTDVAPLVISTVETYGKPVVVEVLTQFGAAKASDVDAARWPELIVALNDAAAAATPLAA